MSKEYRVTSAGASAAEDRAHRMRMYFIAMTLRVLCVVSLFWVHGWWIVIPVVGSVVFPWFAVMVGNAVAQNTRDEIDAPEPLELLAPDSPEADVAPELIVLDVEPTRRSTATGTTSPRDDDLSDRQRNDQSGAST